MIMRIKNVIEDFIVLSKRRRTVKSIVDLFLIYPQ